MASPAGKTALVTGASRGIGRASALALPCEGAQVLVHYGRGKAEAEAVAAEIRSAGGWAGNGYDRSGCRGWAAQAGRTGSQVSFGVRLGNRLGDRLDILAANAGVSKSANIEDTTVDDFDRLFAVNVRES